jgi:hypothetical protein
MITIYNKFIWYMEVFMSSEFNINSKRTELINLADRWGKNKLSKANPTDVALMK